jgi:hypothetical protein
MSDLDDLEEIVGPNSWRPRQRRHRSGSMQADRPTHCKRGHELTPENTYTQTWGGYEMRSCKRCRRLLARTYRERER